MLVKIHFALVNIVFDANRDDNKKETKTKFEYELAKWSKCFYSSGFSCKHSLRKHIKSFWWLSAEVSDRVHELQLLLFQELVGR